MRSKRFELQKHTEREAFADCLWRSMKNRFSLHSYSHTHRLYEGHMNCSNAERRYAFLGCTRKKKMEISVMKEEQSEKGKEDGMCVSIGWSALCYVDISQSESMGSFVGFSGRERVCV